MAQYSSPYSGQEVDAAIARTDTLARDIEDIQATLDATQDNVTQNGTYPVKSKGIYAFVNGQYAKKTALNSEEEEREEADAALESQIESEVTARQSGDQELRDLLKGKLGAGALAGRNPYVNVGDLGSWVDANAAVDALLEDTTAYQYSGRLRFTVTGGNYEMYMFVRSYAQAVWVQMVMGCVAVSGGKLTAAGKGVFAVYVRERNESGSVTAWGMPWATAEELASEVSARSSGDAANATAAATALKTALGTGAQDAWDVPVKMVVYGSTAQLTRLLNEQLFGGSYRERGVTLYRYVKTGGHFIVITGGLNEELYPTNGARGCTQMAIGNLTAGVSYTKDDKGHDWAEEGVPNGISVHYEQSTVFHRRLYYSGGVAKVTRWQAYELQDGVRGSIQDAALRGLYGASNGSYSNCTYNEETGYYEMNGLTDITPAEMGRIWCCSANRQVGAHALAGFQERTNYGFAQNDIYDGYAASLNGEFSLFGLFYNNKNLVVCRLTHSGAYGARGTDFRSMFRLCAKLVRVIGFLNVGAAKNEGRLGGMFYGCAALEEVQVYQLKLGGLSFADSPLLSAASVKYLVENAANTAAITVTVHADTLANLTGGEGDWAGVLEAAAAKGISFITG